MLKEIFNSVGIEYFAAVDYAECKTVNGRLEQRLPFEPKTVLVFLVPYHTGECVNISRYAASRDYHIIIGEICEKLIAELKKQYPVSSFAGFSDHSPIDERGCALRGGLGFIGENGLLINEKYGSYVFLGDIVSDIPKDVLGISPIAPTDAQKCLGCGACRRACPTGFLRGESRECLSAITQRKGELTESEMALMVKYNTVWGCDVCQSVCPHNATAAKTPIAGFYEGRIEELTRNLLNAMTEEQFRERAFAWRGRAVVERNLEIYETAKKGG